MPKWFRREAAEGVSRASVKALDSLLQRYAGVDARSVSMLRDYVLTGSPRSALQGVPSQAGYIHYGQGSEDPAHEELFAGLGELAPELGVRLGQALDAGRASFLRGQPAHLGWIEALLQTYLRMVEGDAYRPRKELSFRLDIEAVEAMSTATGRPANEPLVAAFQMPSGPSYYSLDRYSRAVRGLKGYAAAVARNADAIRPAFAATKVDDRLLVMQMLAGCPPEVLMLFADELAVLASATSTQVRAAALPLIRACGPAGAASLRKVAVDAKPDARRLALEELLKSPADRAWALETAAADRAPSVQALTEEKVVAESAPDEPLPIVEVPEISWRLTVTPEMRAALDVAVSSANQAIERSNRSSRAAADRWAAQHGRQPTWHRDTPLIDRTWLAAVVKALGVGKPPKKPGERPTIPVHFIEPPLLRVLPDSGLGAVGLLIVMAEAGWIVDGNARLSMTVVNALHLLQEQDASLSLLAISTMLDQIGYDGNAVVANSYASTWRSLGRRWPDDSVAPFVLLNLDRMLGLIGPGEHDWHTDQLAGFDAIASLPSVPASVAETLFDLALGSRKTVRRPAQDALAKVPGHEDRVVAALKSGKSEIRTLAAQWLRRLGHEAAVPALEEALAKEKQDVTIGALLDALQAFGRPVENYLDRSTLATQAEKAVAKGLPKDLAWFPWDALPPLHWNDGTAVALPTVQWLLAQAVRSKTAEPNALLRNYCSMFEPVEREAFGQFVLESWVAEDLRPIDEADARSQARQAATYEFQAIRRWPDHYKESPFRDATEDQIFAVMLPRFLRQPRGSAIASKGVLAVAAACAGERAAGVAGRYLKEWYGLRVAQGRALIVMLAWVEHPGATQLMLSIGGRFRTKSLQEEATKQAAELAERKGWTIGELADRTIPSAGFDETGVLSLSYGDREFAARLLPDLGVELRSPEDKVIKALPAPRQTDDESAARAAKKNLAAAKKELKAVGQLQAERLYEALCTERTWAYDDWERYLHGHPVMRHLVQRLAWTASTDEDPTVVFRPLGDGSLTDADDEAVLLESRARIAVAHDSLLTADEVAAWQQHFADYEVAPLFQQFGKGMVKLPEETLRGTELADFTGHLVEAFALRGRAGKLGYVRGSTEDGGWFYTYVKRFPTLGVSAEVEFSGNPLPEENRTVALKQLSFVAQDDRGGSSRLRLSEVPSVLLSEAWNDLRLMAADGPGFDADWERKVEF